MTINIAPCKGCEEKRPACSARCPKDERGEYGYSAWLADYRKVQAAEAEYKRKRREDYLHSEECKEAQKAYSNSKSRQRRGNNHGR